MNVKVLSKMLAVTVLSGGVLAATVPSSLACSGRAAYSKVSQQSLSLPGWVGTIALGTVGATLAGNEIAKRRSADKPIG